MEGNNAAFSDYPSQVPQLSGVVPPPSGRDERQEADSYYIGEGHPPIHDCRYDGLKSCAGRRGSGQQDFLVVLRGVKWIGVEEKVLEKGGKGWRRRVGCVEERNEPTRKISNRGRKREKVRSRERRISLPSHMPTNLITKPDSFIFEEEVWASITTKAQGRTWTRRKEKRKGWVGGWLKRRSDKATTGHGKNKTGEA
ncbi:hypothetical protein Pmani_019709 [Petrolisthes manimaculis]|uniref:Uncharacterized protein n=1 Tax=Petrolisthes manimaculis TaxID=1843537 RepID=A0AAE1U741_9EUCA|nr:hypothetical protein Pmani_019709 [Petrolisthes manimaculis]